MIAENIIVDNNNKLTELYLIDTLNNNIDLYNRWGWSSYDLVKGNFAPTLYHYIHVFTLCYLSIMLDIKKLSAISDQWRKGINLNNYNLVNVLRLGYAASRRTSKILSNSKW